MTTSSIRVYRRLSVVRSRHFLAAVAAALLATSPLLAADGPRAVHNFDADWRFNKGDAAGAEAPAFADTAWRTVSVPHDWAMEGPFAADAPSGNGGGHAPSGVSWYRKSFTVDPADAGKKLFIDFDGVMANSDVWINGFHLGKRPYGYVSFRYELTGHLNAGGANVIAVRTDTTQQPASRYYEGAGIVRHVRLVATDAVHLDYNGTFVTTPKAGTGGAADGATVHVRSTVVNQSDAPRAVSLHVTLLDPEGKPAGTADSAAQTVAAGQSADFDAEVAVAKPALWNLDSPKMYTATAAVMANGANGGAAIDDETVPFGIRTIEFRAATGFWLNDKNMKLKGECLHADIGAFGIAVPEDEWINRLQAIKALGCDAVRTAHNPPSPEFLSACDKVGILVMDEMFDCWQTGKNTYDYHLFFRDWNQTDTRDTVRRDRNHPSIVLYSAGNEIREPSGNPALAKTILAGLLKEFHENDPTRPVTQAILQPNGTNNPAAPASNPNGSYMNGFADMLDVIGTNYRDQEIIRAWQEKPTRKIVGTENNKDAGSWAAVRDNAEYSGSFIWTGVDYFGETGAFPAIGAGAGVFDMTNRPKGEAYQRGEWWADKPVVYMTRAPGGGGPGGLRGGGINPGGPMIPAAPPIDGGLPAPGADAGRTEGSGRLAMGGDGAQRAPTPWKGWAWDVFQVAAPGGGGAAAGGRGRGGAAGGRGAGGGRGRGAGPAADWTPANLNPHQEMVNVYSNCDDVELFLNGNSLGSKPKGAIDSVRTWAVDFASGTLKAVGKNKGQAVATQELATAGKAAKITLKASTDRLFDDYDSAAHVTVMVTDDKGVEVPTAADVITFKVSGPGILAGTENGQMVNQDFRAATHAAYNGECVAFVQAKGSDGKITLTASAPGLTDGTVTFEAAPGRR